MRSSSDTKGWWEANEVRLRSTGVQRDQLPQRVHRTARRSRANELEATVPRFTGMFEMNLSLGVEAPLNYFGTLAKDSRQTEFPKKKKRT